MLCVESSRPGIHGEGEIEWGDPLTGQSRILMKPPSFQMTDEPLVLSWAWAAPTAGCLHSVNTSIL